MYIFYVNIYAQYLKFMYVQCVCSMYICVFYIIV